MGDLFFTSFEDIDSRKRLNEWFNVQSREGKPIYYLLPSFKWLQSARKTQPGIAFQTFDDLPLLLLETAKVEFTSITDEDRGLLFYEILNSSVHNLSEKELSQKAQAYADSYGQLKRLGLRVEETPRPLEELKEIFYTYESKYRDRLGLFDQENRIFKTVETAISDFPLSHVVIDGFIDFTPIQYSMIDYLIKASVPLTIYLPLIDTPIIQETFTALKNLGIQIHDEKSPVMKPVCQKTNVTGATSIEEEIHGVLETIAQCRGEEKYSQFGIVLVNEQDYLTELERISKQRKIPLGLAKKRSLKETEFLPFLRQVLNKAEWNTKWGIVPFVDAIAKLCFLPAIEFNKVKDTFIRTGKFTNEDIGSIIETIKQFQLGLPEDETVSQYMKQLQSFLDSLPFPTLWRKIIKAKIPSKLQQVSIEFRAFQCIKEFVKQAIEMQQILDIKIQLDTFRNRLIQKLENESLYIDRKPTDGIELYSFRDVPLFKGKHLFVLGLNEGKFPKQTNLNGYFQERYLEGVFKPYPLPLAGYFRKKDDAGFEQLKYLAETLSFSYVEGMNPNQQLLPSKYITGLSKQTDGYSTISRLQSDTFLSKEEYEGKLAYHNGIGKELLNVPPILGELRKNTERLQSGEELISDEMADRFSVNRTSITMLESYASCSFKFGLERLLKVKEPLEKQQRIDPLETGTMLHRIIERFYREAKGIPFKNLGSFFQGKDEEKLADIFEEEWRVVQQKHDEISLFTLIKEKEEWWKKLRRWLAAERYRFWENEQLADMSIFKMEEPVEFSIEMESNTLLTLTGKIDRVDVDESGFVIYDYKSSEKVLDFKNQVPAGLMLQIPLYIIALGHEFTQEKYQSQKNKEAIGGGYISIKTPHHRKKNTVWKDEEQKSRFGDQNHQTNIIQLESESMMQEFQIPKLIGELWRGTFTDFSVRPYSAESCKYCIYKAICRVTKEQQDS